MKGHYVNIWAPGGRGIFKVASACHIKPGRKQRHSFKGSTQKPHHSILGPDSERDLRPGSRLAPPVPFSLAACCTGWFCDGLQCQLAPSGLGGRDQISLPTGKAFLEDTQKATIVTNGAWQAWDRGSHYLRLKKRKKMQDGSCIKSQIVIGQNSSRENRQSWLK